MLYKSSVYVAKVLFMNKHWLKVLMMLSGWEGGEDWLRSQFRAYLVSMLSAVSQKGQLYYTMALCEP